MGADEDQIDTTFLQVMTKVPPGDGFDGLQIERDEVLAWANLKGLKVQEVQV